MARRDVNTGFTRSGGAIALVSVVLASLIAAEKPSKPVDLSMTDLNGARVRLRDLRGKPVVLNFWATWCVPCKQEMPLLVDAEREYKQRGVTFLGLSLDDKDTRGRIPDFLAKYGVKFPIWTGASGDTLAELKMGEAVPATAFIDPEGRIVARISGLIRKEELKERIDYLLSDRSGPAPKAFVEHLEK